MKKRRLLDKALSKPAALRFTEVCRLAEAFGYRLDRVTTFTKVHAQLVRQTFKICAGWRKHIRFGNCFPMWKSLVWFLKNE